MAKLRNALQSALQKYGKWFELAYIVITPAFLAAQRRNSTAFILFLISLYLLSKSALPARLRLAIAAVDLAVVMPYAGFASQSFANVAAMIGIYAILALGLNIVVGFTGLLNLGYAAFYAVGAYTYAIFASRQASNFMSGNFPISGYYFWPFLLLAFGVTGLVGFLVGLPALRLKGDYLAIVTLGFAEIIRLVFNNLSKPINITNGPQGITPISAPMLFGVKLNRPVHYYMIVLGLFVLSYLFVIALQNSRYGRAWAAIREDELVARTMGVNVVRMKILSFVIGAGLAGMMGVVFAARQTFVDPTSFTFMESMTILCMVILGGLGSTKGVVIGAMAVVTLQLEILKDISAFFVQLSNRGILNIPSNLSPINYERLIFGLIMVLMCIFRPGGIMPEKRLLPKIFGESASDEALSEGGGPEGEA